MTICRPFERDAIYRQDLLALSWKAFEVLNPGASWFNNWHIEKITDRLTAVVEGRCKRLIINLPPRTLKSHLASVALPAFMFGRDPTSKIICVSYSQDLASKHASDCRRLIESPFYRNLNRHVRLTKSTESELETDKGGFRKATSVGGTITGRGGNLIVIDDPLNAVDVHSKTKRQAVNDWYSSSLITRLDNPNTDAIVVIMQRFHEDDLAGRLSEQGGWEILALPAIAPSDICISLPNGRSYRWKKDEALHEERASRAHLDTQRAQMGGSIFNAQYLQAPLPETGNMLKRHWLQFEDTLPARQLRDEIIQSWDTALKASSSSDYSVCLTFQIRNKNEYHLIHVFREQLEFPDLVKQVITLAQRFTANAVLIEDHASGTSLIQTVRRSGLQGVIPIKVESDKATRMMAATPKLEAGSLILPRDAPGVDAFLAEYLAFPFGKHDDLVDALSQFLNYRQNKEDNVFEFDFGHNEPPESPDAEMLLWALRR
jgi:predicted phage terminase large subunit-like protein